MGNNGINLELTADLHDGRTDGRGRTDVDGRTDGRVARDGMRHGDFAGRRHGH